MKEDQKRSVMIMIGIITLLQILSQYIRYSECTDLGGDSRCIVRSSLIGAGNFGYAYSIFEITTTFLLIMSLQLAYKKSPKLFALITSIFILKISRILLVFLAKIVSPDYFQDSLKFSIGYAWRFNNWGNYEFVLNPVLLTSNIAIPILLIILIYIV